jgi:hypothetical protein
MYMIIVPLNVLIRYELEFKCGPSEVCIPNNISETWTLDHALDTIKNLESSSRVISVTARERLTSNTRDVE